MQYLHTMIRIKDIEKSLDFYCNKLGLIEVRRIENESARFTLIFLCAEDDLENAKINKSPLIELTYNWPDEQGNTGVFQGSCHLNHTCVS